MHIHYKNKILFAINVDFVKFWVDYMFLPYLARLFVHFFVGRLIYYWASNICDSVGYVSLDRTFLT